MVESLDAYRLARYLRTKGELIEGIEDFLFRYCDPEPLTEEGFPIYMLKTKAPNGSCIFLMDGRCSVYPARTRTCRIYPLTVGPGERGRDFEYCLCLDRHRSHFTGSRVSVKDWLYQNFKREGGLHPYCQDKDHPLLPIFIGYCTDLIPPPPLIEFSLVLGSLP